MQNLCNRAINMTPCSNAIELEFKLKLKQTNSIYLKYIKALNTTHTQITSHLSMSCARLTFAALTNNHIFIK